MLEPVARERYNAWRAVTDLSEETAMREYIDMVRWVHPHMLYRARGIL